MIGEQVARRKTHELGVGVLADESRGQTGSHGAHCDIRPMHASGSTFDEVKGDKTRSDWKRENLRCSTASSASRNNSSSPEPNSVDSGPRHLLGLT